MLRVALILAALLLVQAQTPAPTGLILGQVVDATTGQPIPEAEVTIRSTATISATSQVPAINTRVLADGNGRYFFAPLPAGSYQIRASKPGYLDGSLGARRPPTISNRAPGVVPFELADAQHVTDATIRIWKQASISGTLTDDSGDPLVNVSVLAFGRTFVSGRPRFTRAGYGTTDDRGVFRISALVPGQYVVAVVSTQTSVPMDAMDRYSRGNASARDALVTEMFDAISEISGPGRNRNQQIGNHLLMTLSDQPTPPAPTVDNVPLVYRTAFFPGDAGATDAQVITIAAGEERTGTNLVLRSVRAVRVSGTVSGPAGALAFTALRLVPAGLGDSFPEREIEPATTLTDNNGRFMFLGVPLGAYVLKLVSPRRPDATSKPMVWAAQSLSVGDRDVTQISVTARSAIKVSGRFEIAPTAGASSAGVNPGVQETLTFSSATEQATYRGTSAKDRTFALELPGGRYSMTFEEPPGWFIVSALVNGRDVRDGTFDLGEDATVVLTYSDDPTRITGTIRSSQGAADPNATAIVFPTDRQRWTGYGAVPVRMTAARAAAGGAYSIANVPAGDYYAIAIADDDAADWTNPATLERLARLATTIAIRDGEKRTLDLRTIPVK